LNGIMSGEAVVRRDLLYSCRFYDSAGFVSARVILTAATTVEALQMVSAMEKELPPCSGFEIWREDVRVFRRSYGTGLKSSST